MSGCRLRSPRMVVSLVPFGRDSLWRGGNRALGDIYVTRRRFLRAGPLYVYLLRLSLLSKVVAC